jgi:hypothetical protein
MTLAAAKWGALTENDKVKYEARKAIDATRFQNQRIEKEKKGWFTMEDGTKSTDAANASKFKVKKLRSKSVEEAKDSHLKPKRNLSTYLYFANEFIRTLREKHDGITTQGEYMKMAGTKWASMTEQDKAKAEKLAEADKTRYEGQKAEVEKKGYFILEDGSKSNDAKNAPAVPKLKRVRREVSESSAYKEEDFPKKKAQKRVAK